MDDREDYELSPLEAQRIAQLREAARLSGLSEKTLRRRFPNLIIRLSPRRQGMRVKDALRLSGR